VHAYISVVPFSDFAYRLVSLHQACVQLYMALLQKMSKFLDLNLHHPNSDESHL